AGPACTRRPRRCLSVRSGSGSGSVRGSLRIRYHTAAPEPAPRLVMPVLPPATAQPRVSTPRLQQTSLDTCERGWQWVCRAGWGFDRAWFDLSTPRDPAFDDDTRLMGIPRDLSDNSTKCELSWSAMTMRC